MIVTSSSARLPSAFSVPVAVIVSPGFADDGLNVSVSWWFGIIVIVFVSVVTCPTLSVAVIVSVLFPSVVELMLPV